VVADAVAWLCRTPRRLAIGLLGLFVVLVLGGNALIGHGVGTSGSLGRHPAAVATTPVAQVPDPNPYVSTAVTFVQQWSQLKKGETAAQWQARLVPLTTPELGAALRTTDPSQLPGVGPQGEPVVRYVAQSSALIAVPLSNGSSVLVTVVSSDGGSRVSDVQPNAGN
jgi:hypothetical protein